MPDARRHRGPHPEDGLLFAADQWPRLQAATSDYCWLLGRAYPPHAALKLVGDRYELAQRQRLAVQRASAAPQSILLRQQRRIELDELHARPLQIDGFNVLTTIEAALSGGVLLAARDGCLRDMASMHGSYRRVTETQPAVALLAEHLSAHCPRAPICWWLDRPVSNSGRLRKLILEHAATAGLPWSVELADNVDEVLRHSATAIASADSHVLDHCGIWCNLAQEVVTALIADAWIVPLR